MPEKMIRTKMVDGSERRISMPSEYVLTFGPNVPFAPREHRFGHSANIIGFALRVYSSTPKMLRMCLPNVVEFWEENTFVIEQIQRDPESQLVVQRVDMGEITNTRRRATRNPLEAQMWAQSMRPAQPGSSEFEIPEQIIEEVSSGRIQGD